MGRWLVAAVITVCVVLVGGGVAYAAGHQSWWRVAPEQCRHHCTTTTTRATTTTTTTTIPATTTTTTVPPPPTYTPTVADDCSVDVTVGLNSFFAELPTGADVVLPTNACYLVSNSTSAMLDIEGTAGVTIQGNGATFQQTFYPCAAGTVQPVLQIESNTNLTVNNVTVDGPGLGCAGDNSEGDYGMRVGNALPGNSGVTFNGVTVENVNGDGVAVYPDLGVVGTSINTGVTFENGTLQNTGYHGVTLEGVNGFTFAHNTVNQVGNFMDLEVDNTCDTTCYDANGNPAGPAEVNVAIEDNTFTNGRGGNWIEANQACVPTGNWTFSGNTFDSTVPFDGNLTGPCTTPTTGLSISDNISSYPVSQGQDFPDWSIVNFQNVTFSGNTQNSFDGTSTYYPNNISATGVGLCGVTTASVTNNTFNNTLVPAGNLCFPTSGPSTGVTECGNTYGLTEPIYNAILNITPPPDPLTDGAC